LSASGGVRDDRGMAGRRGVAVITGSSSGFGLLSALELAGAGFRVYATMRDPGKRAKLDEAARAEGVAGAVEVLPLDVASDASVAAAFDRIRRGAGRVDVLVSNAGFGMAGFVEELTLDEVHEQFETNFFGAVRVVKAVLPRMRERRRGRIVLMSSIGVFNTVPGLSAYNSSKAALQAFGEALRYEMAPYGVFVSVVQPGTYATDIFEANARRAEGMRDPASPYRASVERMERVAMRNVELRRRADPRAVARTVRQAATARRPRLRYLVGVDARILRPVRALTPNRLTEAVFSRIQRGRTPGLLP
jgi:NAD(P)-dependent dehydrogenase (short-subunit alcohol dehydrogenase family)